MACMALQLSIFCDFDGTITTVDTGDEFFAEFSTVFDDSMARLMSGKSSVRDYYHDVVRGLRPISSEMVQDLRYAIRLMHILPILSNTAMNYHFL